jgi:hypothetical protein
VADPQTAWRCSQCGTVNEPGARVCSGCGKWPSLFDLQNTVDDAPVTEEDFDDLEPEAFEPEVFDPDAFEAETFEPQRYEPRRYETGRPQQPEVFEPDADDEERSDRARVRRWLISAIWVIGIVVWFLVNVLSDR